jgi:4-hydroxy-tetrahydrodipicolinate reductase
MLHRSMTDQHHGQVMRLLESGKNVVTALDYFFPPAVSPDYALEVTKACQNGGTTLMGIGNSPGFICERVTTTVSSHCLEIDHIEVVEKMDCSYISEIGFPVMGFGMTPEDFANAGVGAMWDPMYKQVPAAVCHLLGAPVERTELTSRIAVADRQLVLPNATVEPGMVCATAWKWTAIVEGRPFFSYETQWVLDREMPGWEADNSWVITVHGKPSIRVTYERAVAYEDGVRRGGGHGEPGYDYGTSILNAAAGVILNAVPGVVAAPPGHFLAPVYGAYQYRSRTR